MLITTAATIQFIHTNILNYIYCPITNSFVCCGAASLKAFFGANIPPAKAGTALVFVVDLVEEYRATNIPSLLVSFRYPWLCVP